MTFRKASTTRGVEVAAALAFDLPDDALERPRVLVVASEAERVEDVADRADAAHQWDLLARQPLRVAGAVPALVVGAGDHLGHLQQR